MASWTNIPNANLAAGAPIRSVDTLAIRDNIINTGENLKNKQVFTSSGTFTVPPNVHRVKVTVIGAGGNGGNASGVGCGSADGGGGGAGGYVVDYVGVTAGGTASVTVGANAGTRTSSFAGGSTITASGGSNGANASGTTRGNYGASGASTIFGLTNYMGGPSRASNTAFSVDPHDYSLSSGTSTAGTGLGSVWNHGFGVGGILRSANAGFDQQHTPLGYGAGAGGGNNVTGATSGGTGTNGLVIVEW